MLYIVITIGLSLIILERIIPDRKLPEVRGWWLRVALINCFQVGVVFLGSYTWDRYFADLHLIALRENTSPFAAAAVSYLVITFVFYWWHRWRHDFNFLWLLCHQLHHSASRIETITSFYKHPVEIILDSILICIINNLLGVGLDGAAFVLLLTAVAEYFYHMNIKTPHWLGYIIQRPEMHRIHHEKGRHYYNFSDLPVWDMFFGTYKNPRNERTVCGFRLEREQKFREMLLFKNVNNEYVSTDDRRFNKKAVTGFVMIGIGLMQTIGYITKSDLLKGIGFMSAASPLPLVFTSVKGIETFALCYQLEIITDTGDTVSFDLNRSVYARLKGPYNRRNVYGAAFAYAPLMPQAQREAILKYGFFNNANGFAKEFGITRPVEKVNLTIKSKTYNDKRQWNYSIVN
jgi:sterol desaturase/sphingolipid hydroxylase (fatty acid hydroxylase superfamily)